MEDSELLNAIKTRLGITGEYHDGLLLAYAEDVKAYMLSGGVRPSVINGSYSVGCIARGVADLWNYGAGDGRFSEVFYQRVIQLALPIVGMEDGSEEFDEITEDEIDEIVGGDTPVKEPDYEIITEEEIDDIIDVETPEYTTPDDIDDIISGDHNEPENPEENPDSEDDEYEYVTKDEIDDLFGDDSSVDDSNSDEEYEYVTKDDVDDLFD